MRKRLFAWALLLMLALPGAARAELSAGALESGAPERYGCAAALLAEPVSGQIIFAVNADEKRPVASAPPTSPQRKKSWAC